jgi:hypothetical protein
MIDEFFPPFGEGERVGIGPGAAGRARDWARSQPSQGLPHASHAHPHAHPRGGQGQVGMPPSVPRAYGGGVALAPGGSGKGDDGRRGPGILV